jgi:phosphatidylglycerol:prolipoprotein diacylglycerol transferase
VLSGVARFLVEFIRINPRIYWGMSNAQVASLGSIAAGILLIMGPAPQRALRGECGQGGHRAASRH